MPKVISQRTPGANADITVPDVVEEFYADGVAGGTIGLPVSRLSFYTVTEPAEGPHGTEKRTVMKSVAIPTMALIQFVLNFAGGLQNSGLQISEANQKLADQFDALLRNIDSSSQK